jgi:hypothetical protein
MTWDGKGVAVTVDGDLFSGYYRKDLFEDPLNQTDFRARYGYELFPPGTWRQYRDIAEFCTGRRLSDGSRVHGTAEAFAGNGQQFWTLFSRASAYTNHMEYPGAQLFDPNTMRALLAAFGPGLPESHPGKRHRVAWERGARIAVSLSSGPCGSLGQEDLYRVLGAVIHQRDACRAIGHADRSTVHTGRSHGIHAVDLTVRRDGVRGLPTR